MKSYLTEDFHSYFNKLPDLIKERARKVYKNWLKNPFYPGLHFKRVSKKENIYPIRIGIGWCALELVIGNSITWFWIGSHADYEKLLSRL